MTVTSARLVPGTPSRSWGLGAVASWPPGPDRPRIALPLRRVPSLASAVAVLVRLAFLRRPLGDDEAGFLVVGGGWHLTWPWGAPGGGSLYGAYWVDRPPLLVTIYRVAALLGGAVPLRLMGCLATVVVVLGCAHVARGAAPRHGSRPDQAAAWAAVVAAALLVTPLTGALEVDGELLAAPFVVLGFVGVQASLSRVRTRAATAAALAGAAAVASLMVKQNILDVVVLGAAAVTVATRAGGLDRTRMRVLVTAFLSGAVACLVLTAAWTLAHGTSLTGVFDAMYPFRLDAGRVLATQPHPHDQARLVALLLSWLACGGVAAMGVVGAALVGRRLLGPVPLALALVVVFDVVSIALGGSYWRHYLLQLVPALAILTGLAVAGRQPSARSAAVLCGVAAAVTCSLALPGHGNAGGATVGRAIRDAASPGDTLVVAWGHPDVVQAAGLPSPYPQLWSLPARTLDPHLRGLDAVLASSAAPTWLVTWTDVGVWPTSRPADVSMLSRLLAERYRPVGRVAGHPVYLRDGLSRPDLSGGA